MKKNPTNSKFFLVMALLALLVQIGCECDKRTPDIQWNYSNIEVKKQSAVRPDSIRIDIYLDGTKSMVGFVRNTKSVYNKFLEELETTAGVGWKTADIRFFKFGTRIKDIDKKEFRASKYKQFYAERGIFERTNIDQVINQTDSSRVSVVITDLFQDEGDVNSIVQQIKERCFMQGIQVAILAIKSEFDGWVYDLGPGNPPYKLKSSDGEIDTYRPFYALMFGDPVNIERLFNNLKEQPFIMEENFLVLSRYIINDVKISLTKSRDSRGLNLKSKRKGEPDNLFKFVLKKGYEQATLIADIALVRNTRTPDFDAGKLELVVFKKAAAAGEKNAPTKDSVSTKDLSLNEIKRDVNKLKVTLSLKLDEPKGTYSYMVFLQCSSIGGLTVPQWVRDFSSENPSAKKDANKTLNLEKFVKDLIRASLTLYQPKLAKMYITITKK